MTTMSNMNSGLQSKPAFTHHIINVKFYINFMFHADPSPEKKPNCTPCTHLVTWSWLKDKFCCFAEGIRILKKLKNISLSGHLTEAMIQGNQWEKNSGYNT